MHGQATRTMICCGSVADKGPFRTVQCVKPTSASHQLSIRGTSGKQAAQATISYPSAN
jgi:hypothetical protein